MVYLYFNSAFFLTGARIQRVLPAAVVLEAVCLSVPVSSKEQAPLTYMAATAEPRRAEVEVVVSLQFITRYRHFTSRTCFMVAVERRSELLGSCT